MKFVYYVNKYLLVASFKLETAEIIRNSVTKDAFFYVPTHQDFQYLLQFNVHGQTYQFKALKFELATAPLVFTPVVNEAKLILQFLLQTKNSSNSSTSHLRDYFLIKIQARVHTRIDFLGYHCILVQGNVFLTQINFKNFRNLFRKWRSHHK